MAGRADTKGPTRGPLSFSPGPQTPARPTAYIAGHELQVPGIYSPREAPPTRTGKVDNGGWRTAGRGGLHPATYTEEQRMFHDALLFLLGAAFLFLMIWAKDHDDEL